MTRSGNELRPDEFHVKRSPRADPGGHVRLPHGRLGILGAPSPTRCQPGAATGRKMTRTGSSRDRNCNPSSQIQQREGAFARSPRLETAITPVRPNSGRGPFARSPRLATAIPPVKSNSGRGPIARNPRLELAVGAQILSSRNEHPVDVHSRELNPRRVVAYAHSYVWAGLQSSRPPCRSRPSRRRDGLG